MRRLAGLLLVAACGHAAPTRPSADSDATAVTAAADAYVARYIEAFPESIDLRGWVEATHSRFNDRSPEAVAAWAAFVDEEWEQIRGIDADRLYGRPEWVTLGFLREALERDRATRVCRFELWGLDPNAGLHIQLADLARVQPAFTDRWRHLPDVVDVEIANLREGLRTGYSAARPVVDRVIAQLDAQLALPVEESPFHTVADADDIVTVLNPALRRYRDFLADEYAPAAREALGVGANPDGEACYRASFRAETSLDRDPDETVRLGKLRVAGFAAEVEDLGLAGLDLDAPDNHFADGDALFAFAKDAVERAHGAMDQLVVTVPDAPVVVEPYPDYLGVAVSPSYDPMPEDQSRPATFWINLQQKTTRGEAEMTAFHETWPGHHLQIATADDLPERHRIAKLVGVGSYVEGWARYAEQLADEIGLYSTPYARVRRRTWPGRGMVVDPGIHLGGWTRAQAVDYMVEGGFPRDVADGLVDRIAAWPAQLTSYDTGALEILAQRAEAQERMGDRFDLRAFDSCVLSQGAITLPMLRKVVEACAR
jgi:uncharacterized protein (DUF885 family)